MMTAAASVKTFVENLWVQLQQGEDVVVELMCWTKMELMWMQQHLELLPQQQQLLDPGGVSGQKRREDGLSYGTEAFAALIAQ